MAQVLKISLPFIISSYLHTIWGLPCVSICTSSVALGIPSDGWLAATNAVCLCPGSNLGRMASLRLASKYFTHCSLLYLACPLGARSCPNKSTIYDWARANMLSADHFECRGRQMRGGQAEKLLSWNSHYGGKFC